MIQVGDRLPEGRLVEYIETEGGTFGPKLFNAVEGAQGKRIAILAVPGVFTPGYLKQVESCKERGVDEVWCMGGTDPITMGRWSRELKSAGKIRMVSDGSGVYSAALGLSKGYGTSAGGRTSMLVENGILKQVNLEASGRLDASNDESALARVA